MKTTLFTFVGAAVAAVFLAVTGCETEKLSETQLTISPSSVTVAPGKSVTFTASGGWDYTWDKPEYGTLSSYNGKKVTYTAYVNALDGTTTTYVDGAPVTQKLEVRNDTICVHSSSSSTTNGAGSATAVITIKGE